MPAREVADVRRGPQLSNILFWLAVALTPAAVALLLLADKTGTLRVAGVLVLAVVVMIGLSVMLSTNSVAAEPDSDGVARDEIDLLRQELRTEIAQAAHMTQQMVADQLRRRQAEFEALRERVERAQPASVPPPVVEMPSRTADRGRAATGPSHGRRVADPQAGSRTDPQVGPRTDPHVDPAAARHSGDWAAQHGPYRGMSHEPGPRNAPGVVQHTETVQVTTRRTVVGPVSITPEPPVDLGTVRPGGETAGRDPHHGRRGSGQGWPDEPASVGPGVGGHHAAASLPAQPHSTRPHQGREPEQANEDVQFWSQLRSHDQWAEYRQDGQGRQVRAGERRASMDIDDDRVEVRVADRWAAGRAPAPSSGPVGRHGGTEPPYGPGAGRHGGTEPPYGPGGVDPYGPGGGRHESAPPAYGGGRYGDAEPHPGRHGGTASHSRGSHEGWHDGAGQYGGPDQRATDPGRRRHRSDDHPGYGR